MHSTRGGENVGLCDRCCYKTTIEFEHNGKRWTQDNCEKEGLPWKDTITIQCINFKERKNEVDTCD